LQTFLSLDLVHFTVQSGNYGQNEVDGSGENTVEDLAIVNASDASKCSERSRRQLIVILSIIFNQFHMHHWLLL